MKGIRKQTIVILSVSMVMVAALPAFAQPPQGSSQGYGRGRSQRMIEALNLTSEQVGEMRKHRSEHREEARTLMIQLRKKRRALREELEKAASEEATIRSLASEIKQLQGQMIDHRLEGVLELKNILTPEQFQTFQEKIKKRGKRFHHKEGHRSQKRFQKQWRRGEEPWENE